MHSFLHASKITNLHSIDSLFSFLITFSPFYFITLFFSFYYCFLLTHITLKELDPNQPQKQLEDQTRVGTEFGFLWPGPNGHHIDGWQLTDCWDALQGRTTSTAWHSLTHFPVSNERGTSSTGRYLWLFVFSLIACDAFFPEALWCAVLIYTKPVWGNTKCQFLLRWGKTVCHFWTSLSKFVEQRSNNNELCIAPCSSNENVLLGLAN